MRISSLFSLICLLFLYSCSKHEDVYGDVHAYGKVLDKESREPIANATVYFYSVILRDRPGLVGSTNEREYTLRDSVVTNSTGKFDFRFKANGQYEFEIQAFPNDGLHVPSTYTVGLKDVVWESGSHYHVLGCHRTSTIKFEIKKVTPNDTIYFSASSGLTYVDQIELTGDTGVYLHVPGDRGLEESVKYNVVRLNPYSYDSHELQQTFSAWDTIVKTINY